MFNIAWGYLYCFIDVGDWSITYCKESNNIYSKVENVILEP